VTVNFQTCNGTTTTPKGRTRRTIPMTSTLVAALKRLDVVRDGLVIRNLDGTAKTDGEANHAIDRLMRKTGLPSVGWHRLRHGF
jgi:integrase